MSKEAFIASRGLTHNGNFQANLFACFRLADDSQASRLEYSFPFEWQEFKERSKTDWAITRTELQEALLKEPDEPTLRELASIFGLVVT